MDDVLDPDSVHDRESFLAFVERLAADRRASVASELHAPGGPYEPGAGGWENVTIEDFLEAAVSWADDIRKVDGRRFPEQAAWRSFALFLFSGKIYE